MTHPYEAVLHVIRQPALDGIVFDVGHVLDGVEMCRLWRLRAQADGY